MTYILVRYKQTEWLKTVFLTLTKTLDLHVSIHRVCKKLSTKTFKGYIRLGQISVTFIRRTTVLFRRYSRTSFSLQMKVKIHIALRFNSCSFVLRTEVYYVKVDAPVINF